MQTFVRIGGTIIAATISGQMQDRSWDGRASKTIRIAMTHGQAAELFMDNVSWSIIVEHDSPEETEEYDNSEFCVAGAITDHRDGTVSIKMGMKTEIELLREQLVTPEGFTQAYIDGVNSI